MSERKVLNKYYPPDFDPTKIPKIKRAKNYKRGVFTIRTMAPFNMRCNTCGEYIYKGKKFNSRKETVENETYLGLHIFRFYIKCPCCIAEIAFKTDPQNTDYELEAGATRNFEASRTAEKMAVQEQKEKEAEEANNPMKVLENRTKASCQEMEMLETLEDLRVLRHRHAGVDTEKMLQQNQAEAERQLQRQEQEDEEFVRSIFGNDGTGIVVKRLNSNDESSEGSDSESVDSSTGQSISDAPLAKVLRISDERKPTDLLTSEGTSTTTVQRSNAGTSSSGVPLWSRSVGTMKCQLSGLVRPKNASQPVASSAVCTTLDKEVVKQVDDSTDKQDGVVTSGNSVAVSDSSEKQSGNIVSAGLAGLGAYSSSSGTDSDGDSN